MKTLLTTCAAAVLAASAANAADVKVMMTPDAEGRVTVQEYQNFMKMDPQFSTWDADGNAIISQDEYVAGFDPEVILYIWDDNKDGQIQGSEIRSSSGAWDADANGVLAADEFSAGVQSDQNFVAWDADKDGMLSQDEYNTGLWNTFDADRDGFWNADERAAWENSQYRAWWDAENNRPRGRE